MSTGPMTDVGSDLFQIGHNYYLVMVDRYSGCPFVEKLSKLSTSAIIKVLSSWFNTFGWPERIHSDNGPQYRTEFDKFCKENLIIPENSSPYYPQSNGLSEAAVKQMKFLLKKVNENANEFSSRLLDFSNTPNASRKFQLRCSLVAVFVVDYLTCLVQMTWILETRLMEPIKGNF